jgi:hypothetical protein
MTYARCVGISVTPNEERDAWANGGRRWITLIVRHETKVIRRGLSVAVIEDEGRPLEAGRQRQASNQAVRLEFKRLWS